uniref:AlNc14C206G8821 protein n=1 Tax=Albugo laibachii Nc14 TaxID=890382 RepID=F0WR13_9STRA|nr:AlNc14C206G8821 [Albugo laibachii Nc14]|eukprot:CCA23773.1 AlNc14C206G8821 [Albugo laibachii Nc14]
MSKKESRYKEEWLVRFGLKIMSYDSKTNEVASLACRFCEFGRDPSPSATHRHSKRIKKAIYYKRPWRTDNMLRHLKHQHSLTFDQYTALSNTEKKTFFDTLNQDFGAAPSSSFYRAGVSNFDASDSQTGKKASEKVELDDWNARGEGTAHEASQCRDIGKIGVSIRNDQKRDTDARSVVTHSTSIASQPSCEVSKASSVAGKDESIKPFLEKLCDVLGEMRGMIQYSTQINRDLCLLLREQQPTLKSKLQQPAVQKYNEFETNRRKDCCGTRYQS